MREHINETVVNERLSAFLATVFAFLAVTLAAVGLYGVLAFMVTWRTREIGVRLALGAGARSVEWLVLREVLVLAGLGLLLGLPAAAALASVMESLLFGVTPYDPLIFTGATLVLLAAALMAGYWPARRASRVDPMTALRYD
jgi:ABC-type antimicrobial peptide transport system permease subunit